MSSTIEVTKVLSMSLNDLMRKLAGNKFLLPALQREYTWKSSQIETLFDSLMQGYPINTMMYWDVDKLSNQNINFYRFLSPDYVNNKKARSENKSLNNEEEQDYDGETRHVVIDGQQRVTSLYIGICGSYNKKRLCLRIDAPADVDDRDGMKYDFRFLTERNFAKLNNEQCWVKVGDVRQDSFEPLEFVLEKDLAKNQFARQTIQKLKMLFSNNDVISYYSIVGHDNIDDVLDIFVRTNSGGTKLTKGDLLLSSFTTDWAKDERGDGRKYVEDIISMVMGNTTFRLAKIGY